jgi:HEPN domain-containing protein
MSRVKTRTGIKPRAHILPVSIFLHAASFREAQLILEESRVPQVQRKALVLPGCVLSAFTSELLIKCLICIERGGKPPRGHDLLELFEKLSARTRKRLEAIWTDHLQLHRNKFEELQREVGLKLPSDLRSALALGGKAFELIRYLYEGLEEEFAFYLGAMPDILGKVVLELRPDWVERARVGRGPEQSRA